MMKPTDKLTFKVAYLKNNKLVVERFNSFAAAAGSACVLECKYFINLCIESENGDYSHTASMYKGQGSSREVVHQWAVDLVANLK